jgi:hypothetical protein
MLKFLRLVILENLFGLFRMYLFIKPNNFDLYKITLSYRSVMVYFYFMLSAFILRKPQNGILKLFLINLFNSILAFVMKENMCKCLNS